LLYCNNRAEQGNQKLPETAAKVEEELYRPQAFGPTFQGHFPAEMRRQMWPLCCGMSILSGFKSVNTLTEQELVDQIVYICTKPRPDFQIFKEENMKPTMTWLTLNGDQMASKKIMRAIELAEFNLIGTGVPRYSKQGLFLRDTGKTWKSA
jgi:hypothetical protein